MITALVCAVIAWCGAWSSWRHRQACEQMYRQWKEERGKRK